MHLKCCRIRARIRDVGDWRNGSAWLSYSVFFSVKPRLWVRVPCSSSFCVFGLAWPHLFLLFSASCSRVTLDADFIGGLTSTQHGHSSNCTQNNKYEHLQPCKTSRIPQTRFWRMRCFPCVVIDLVDRHNRAPCSLTLLGRTSGTCFTDDRQAP